MTLAPGLSVSSQNQNHSTFLADKISGPFYSQLGVSGSFDHLRKMFQERAGTGSDARNAIRIEEITLCPKEGKSASGCPIAKEVKKPYNQCL
jgi:hypothetical protein